MFSVVFAFFVSILLIAGSTQIDIEFLSFTQFIVGVWFSIAGAIAGWQLANRS